MNVGRQATEAFERLCREKRWAFEDVGNKRNKTPAELGCDYLVRIDGRVVKVEVKGSKSKGDIPDAFETEFDLSDEAHPKFVADWLFIFYVPEGGEPIPSAIPKADIDAYRHRVVRSVKLSSTLKTEMKRGRWRGIPEEL